MCCAGILLDGSTSGSDESQTELETQSSDCHVITTMGCEQNTVENELILKYSTKVQVVGHSITDIRRDKQRKKNGLVSGGKFCSGWGGKSQYSTFSRLPSLTDNNVCIGLDRFSKAPHLIVHCFNNGNLGALRNYFFSTCSKRFKLIIPRQPTPFEGAGHVVNFFSEVQRLLPDGVLICKVPTLNSDNVRAEFIFKGTQLPETHTSYLYPPHGSAVSSDSSDGNAVIKHCTDPISTSASVIRSNSIPCEIESRGTVTMYFNRDQDQFVGAEMFWRVVNVRPSPLSMSLNSKKSFV